MDQTLLRSYFATVYEFPTNSGTLRASLDGEIVQDHSALPELLTRRFAVLTAYNPRSMLLPRRVNEQRYFVLRDLLILGCYRVEPCVGSESEPEGVWREPAYLVHSMDRDEAISFGRVFRQNTILYAQNGRPELIITDIRMPDLDGRALYREIATRWPGRIARVVFVTGDTLTAALREFVDESGRPVIEKPFLPSEVRRVVADRVRS